MPYATVVLAKPSDRILALFQPSGIQKLLNFHCFSSTGKRQRQNSGSTQGGGNMIKEKAGKIWGIVGKVTPLAP